jgi:hypothetical protein
MMQAGEAIPAPGLLTFGIDVALRSRWFVPESGK